MLLSVLIVAVLIGGCISQNDQMNLTADRAYASLNLTIKASNLTQAELAEAIGIVNNATAPAIPDFIEIRDELYCDPGGSAWAHGLRDSEPPYYSIYYGNGNSMTLMSFDKNTGKIRILCSDSFMRTVDLCKSLESVSEPDEYIRNSCMMSIMMKEANDTDFCDSYFSGEDREKCLFKFLFDTEVGRRNRNDAAWAGTCGNLTDPELKDPCYSRIALYSKDTSLCELVTGESTYYTRDSCYYDIAGYSSPTRPELCREIKDEAYKDYCYYYFAARSLPNQPELCQEIKDEALRETCINGTASD